MLTKGYETVVDDEWYPVLTKWAWKVRITKNKVYAQRSAAGGEAVIMHRYIMMATGRSEIDHINGNSLDNRRENLRFCTRSMNMHNRGPQKNNKTGYKGVCFDKSRGKYIASISCNRKQYNLGRYKTAEEARDAYEKKQKEILAEISLSAPLEKAG